MKLTDPPALIVTSWNQLVIVDEPRRSVGEPIERFGQVPLTEADGGACERPHHVAATLVPVLFVLFLLRRRLLAAAGRGRRLD